MFVERRFRNRIEAGALLGKEVLRRVRGHDDIVVLALPRGGVPVAFEGDGGHRQRRHALMNDPVLAHLAISQKAIDAVADREQRELERREAAYRGERPPLDVSGRNVIVVDDGLATGSTMRAAVRALRGMSPRSITVAVPAAARSTCQELRAEADEVICLRTPEPFQAVGLWYEDFDQTTDAEVHRLLEKANAIRKEHA